MTLLKPSQSSTTDLPRPARRPRRLRQSAPLRALHEETKLTPDDLIQPLFVIDGSGSPEPVASMPGVVRHTVRSLVDACHELVDVGVPAVALFPYIDANLKTPEGEESLNPDTLVLRATRAIKDANLPLAVISDVALDPYTSHGHDGVLTEDGTNVDNDRTVDILAQMAVMGAEAGVDVIAPSDMMDGRVAAIRSALDASGFTQTVIMAYSAKFASAYYGPFRDAVGSAKAAGTTLLDKKTYQLSPGNRLEAISEAQLDEAEHADIVMVKPAGPYLDIIRDVRENTRLPVAAYQVSGEYAQIHAAAQQGWLDLTRCRDESLLAIKRAGADMILTYFAQEVAQALS
ncbi:MAG: porphobilinogen synthase [Deinococcota bacterium]